MIPIAGVLLLIVVVFTVGVVVSNPEVFELSIFGANVPVNAAGLYLVGAGAMLVLILAAALLRRGVRRELRRRRQVKTLRTAASGVTRPAPEQPSPAVPPAVAASSAQRGSDAGPTAGSRVLGVSESGRVTPPSPGSPDTTTAAERQALLDEAEELTGDSSER